MSVRIVHLRGTTVKVENTIRDFDGVNLIDPDTHEITIYDSKNVLKVTETNPTKVSQGVYYFYYTIPETGEPGAWRVEWKATKTQLPSKTRLEFLVTA